MKVCIPFLLLATTTIASAANCDITTLSAIAISSDATRCKTESTFVVPVESTKESILGNFDSICGSEACASVLEALSSLDECVVGGVALHGDIVSPIVRDCNMRALLADIATEVEEDSYDAMLAEEIVDSGDSTSASGGSDDNDTHLPATTPPPVTATPSPATATPSPATAPPVSSAPSGSGSSTTTSSSSGSSSSRSGATQAPSVTPTITEIPDTQAPTSTMVAPDTQAPTATTAAPDTLAPAPSPTTAETPIPTTAEPTKAPVSSSALVSLASSSVLFAAVAAVVFV